MIKPNLMFVITSPSGGGAERNAVSLINLFVLNGYKVVVVCTNNQIDKYGLTKDALLFLISYKDQNRYDKLLEVIAQYSIDVVVLPNHWLTENFRDISWFKAQVIKVIAQEHSMFFYPLYTGQYSLFNLRLKAYKNVDVLTCLSQMDLELWKLSGIPQARYVQNLMTNLVKNSGGSIKPFSQRSHAIAIVGRMVEVKGLYNLPKYLEGIHKVDPSVSFWMLGDFSSKVEKFYFFHELKKRGIVKSVYWKPFSADVADYIMNAKFLFLPSLVEGSPMVISEARQLGTPCLLFGLNYLDNGQSGVVHANGFDESFLSVVKNLLTNESYWNEYSIGARSNLEIWGTEAVLSVWQEIFASLYKAPEITRDEFSCLNQNQFFLMQEFHKAMDFMASSKLCEGPDSKLLTFRSFIYFLKKIRKFLRKSQ